MPKEVFTYEHFPLTQEPPQPIYDYMQKHKCFPAELVVNPVNKPPFRLDEYRIQGPNPNPSAPLLPDRDVPTYPPVYYIVAIKYDAVGLYKMVCQGRAERE